MEDAGECSGSKAILDQRQPWARLVPRDSKYAAVDMLLDEMVISSEITFSSHVKREWCKISRNSNECSATIQNKSSETILVDGSALQSEDMMFIKSGSEIVPGLEVEGHLSYIFETKAPPEQSEKRLKISVDVDIAKCCICLNMWHDVVTTAPCLHNFCNGCFSEWLKRSQRRHSAVLCPQCRATVQFVGRNHFLNNIVEEFLCADSSLRRSDEEAARLSKNSSIQSNLVITPGGKRKRTQMAPEEEVDSANLLCPQCGTTYGGFHCGQNIVHIQCQACGGMMPSRSDTSVPQHCLGCNRAFCGAYWHSQGVSTSDNYTFCRNDNFKPVTEWSISGMPFIAHERNRHEQDITERCIRQMGRTLQDVISEWIEKFNNGEIDRARLTLNQAERITARTHLCHDCYGKLVSFLLYWFRVITPKYLLPPDAANRQDCWYGYACRTQHHNDDHARKRNHVCRPTRGNNP
ncbi:hypothetical protein MLD38_017762 [Melastoma candidum]|uniref:Uncharacterized protein n=1 Tax=Melastoma candidum TaxID=119954 RepID=A0ACB9QUT6_9MYRT|nr:hypothetical protein MLD38_017762 [Melastoma candidum]